MALSKTTQDHDEIRKWAEARGAVPSEVESTENNGEVGIIRLEFPKAPNANDSALKEISWEQFFEKFDASGLALVYQEMTADGERSNFNRLVHPEDAKAAPARRTGSKSPAKKSAVSKAPTKAPARKSVANQPAPKGAVAKSSAKKAVGGKSAVKKTVSKSPAKGSSVRSSGSKAVPAKSSPASKSSSKTSKKSTRK